MSVGLILHLHRLLFSFTDGRGGNFKTIDNLVVDRQPDGGRTVRFEPVSAQETPFFVDELVTRTRGALEGGQHHPLIVVAAFVLDLLCIHPFADGNGRVARLATTYLPAGAERVHHRAVCQHRATHLRRRRRAITPRFAPPRTAGSTTVRTTCGRGPTTCLHGWTRPTQGSSHASLLVDRRAPNRIGSVTTSCCTPASRSRLLTSVEQCPA